MEFTLNLAQTMDRRVSERRKTNISYKRRKYDRRNKTFKYHRTIHLSDTNMFGSVYFARFFEFQGEAREEFLQYFMGQDLVPFMKERYGMVTVEANCQYKSPLYLYDDITVDIQVAVLKRAKFKLIFTIKNDSSNNIAAVAEQWIGFTSSNGTPISIPEIVLRNLKKHQYS